MESTKRIQVVGPPMIKFQKMSRLKSLQDGKLYMRSLAYYRKREEETGDDTVGDSFEAMIHVNDGHLNIPELATSETLSDTLIRTTYSNYFVFCILSLPEGVGNFQYTDEQKEKILGFGDMALLIKNRNEFLHRVAVALDREGLKGQHGYVNYYDETADSIDYWASLIKYGVQNVAFWKRKRYTYQQEYRFMIEPPATTEKDEYVLDIGSIADISEIMPAKQVLEGIVQTMS